MNNKNNAICRDFINLKSIMLAVRTLYFIRRFRQKDSFVFQKPKTLSA